MTSNSHAAMATAPSDTNYQGLFLDVFLATQLNWSWRFLSFLGFYLEFFLGFP